MNGSQKYVIGATNESWKNCEEAASQSQQMYSTQFSVYIFVPQIQQRNVSRCRRALWRRHGTYKYCSFLHTIGPFSKFAGGRQSNKVKYPSFGDVHCTSCYANNHCGKQRPLKGPVMSWHIHFCVWGIHNCGGRNVTFHLNDRQQRFQFSRTMHMLKSKDRLKLFLDWSL